MMFTKYRKKDRPKTGKGTKKKLNTTTKRGGPGGEGKKENRITKGGIIEPPHNH